MASAGELQAAAAARAAQVADLDSSLAARDAQLAGLEASLAAKDAQLADLEASLAAKTAELARADEVGRGVLDEKTRHWEGRERALTDKLAHQDALLREMAASNEVAQRIAASGGGGDGDGDQLLVPGSGRAAELEIVTRDLERTTLRLAEVEGRNEQLRLTLETQAAAAAAAATAASGQGVGMAAVDRQQQQQGEDAATLARLQQENAGLLRKVAGAKHDAEEAAQTAARTTRGLQRTVAALQADTAALRARLARCADYDDVKRELAILQAIEFSTGDDDDDAATDAPLDRDGGGTKESLELLLLARNKRLGSELTVLRVSHQDLTQRLQALQQALDATAAELTVARALNQKLEDDLLALHQPSAAPASAALSVAGTYVSRYPQSSVAARSARISPASSIVGGSHLDSLPGSGTGGGGSGGGSGILPMVMAQRDRFKLRNGELEAALAAAHSTIAGLRDEVAGLQKDNLALYEKTRFVSSFSPQSRGPQPPAAASSGFSTNPGTAAGAGAGMDRYRQAYEATISPFEAFRGRESARAYRRMRVPERLLYSLTRLVLASRLSRNLFAAYCLALHALVVSMLYWGARGAGGTEFQPAGFDGRLRL